MLYTSDFINPPKNIRPKVNRNAFTVNLHNDNEKRKLDSYSVAYVFKPLLYFSSIVAMNTFSYCKSGITVNGVCSKIHCLFTVITYAIATGIIKPLTWKPLEADVPLIMSTKTFIILQNVELIYDIFCLSFGNSIFYIQLIRTIDDIDIHFGTGEKLFFKRRRFTFFLLFATIGVFFSTLLFKFYHIYNLLTYITFLFILVHGVTCIFFLVIIYTHLLNLNRLLLEKCPEISESKKLLLEDDITTSIIRVSRI